jgi:hypothetical protein
VEEDSSDELEPGEGKEEAGVSAHCRLATCSSCIGMVTSSFATRIKAVCGRAIAHKIPANFPWVKSAAAALCAMATKPGKPRVQVVPLSVHRQLRVPQLRVLGGRLHRAEAGCSLTCDDDDDCLNVDCTRGSYPLGPTLWEIQSVAPPASSCYQSKQEPSIAQEFPTAPLASRSRTPCVRAKSVRTANASTSCCNPARHAPIVEKTATARLVAAAEAPTRWATMSAAQIGNYFWKDDEFYCTEILGIGDTCDPLMNALCTRGIRTSEGVCLEQKIDDGETCPDFDREDCTSRYCARGTYPAGDPVCCSDIYVYSPTQDTRFCPGIQGIGAECGANALCSNGACFEGACIEPKGRGESCPDYDFHLCATGSCARGSYPLRETICCLSDNSVYSPTTDDYFCTGIQEIKSFCDSDETSSSGVFFDDLCFAAT